MEDVSITDGRSHRSSGTQSPEAPDESFMQLDFTLEEDIPANLDSHILLTRQGRFKNADDFYTHVLRRYQTWSPVAIARVDRYFFAGDLKMFQVSMQEVAASFEQRSESVSELQAINILREVYSGKHSGDSLSTKATERLADILSKEVNSSNDVCLTCYRL
jgi:hypothetical protein